MSMRGNTGADEGTLRLAMGALLVAVLASALFMLLYRFDNKYQYPGNQPIAGVLMLSGEEFEAHPLRFLTREWAYYPGVLLTPEDFAKGSPQNYMQYVSIGQYGGLDVGNPSREAHGSGTYRLVLSLPSPGRVYALELPEVYSACKLYIGGQLALELGETGEEAYQSGLQNRIVSFYGLGQVELLLAVTDYSGYYSGLVYPPAFGDQYSVEQMRQTRLFLRTAILLLALGGMVIAGYFGIRLRRGQALLFAAVCLCQAVSACYPLVHTFFLLPFQPWYVMELLCSCMMPLLVVLLQNGLCGFSKRTGLIFVLPGLLLLLPGMAAVAFPGRISFQWREAFSGALDLLKAYEALYLIVTCSKLLRRNRKNRTLLGAAIFFAVSLVFDRLLPLYEPVYSGWFPELGGLAVAVGLSAVLWAELGQAYREKLVLEQERDGLRRQLSFQEEHYRALTGQIEQTRAARHDLKQHMRLLQSFAASGDTEAMIRYVNEYELPAGVGSARTYSNRHAADAILQHYAARARESGGI